MARKPKEPRPQDIDRERVIANANHFTAVAFRGVAGYERIEKPTLDEARAAAPSLYTNRPIMIYAVALNLDGATERVVHVENWQPKKEG